MAFVVDQDMPRLLPRLADVGRASTELEKAFEFSVRTARESTPLHGLQQRDDPANVLNQASTSQRISGLRRPGSASPSRSGDQ